MRRKLFTLAAGVSAVAFVATAVLWVRGYVVEDQIVAQSPRRIMFAKSSMGRLWVFQLTFRPDQNAISSSFQHSALRPEVLDVSRQKWVVRYWHTPLFTFRSGRSVVSSSLFDVTVPCWFVALLAAVLPVRWLILRRGRWRRERRSAAGMCPACGYDLRATPGGCPECGAVPATKGGAGHEA